MKNFWKRVEIIPFHACHEWTGPKSPKGYGWHTAFGAKMAHRVSWIYHNGKIPKGLHVLHKCDNPGCVRIEHLYLGTNNDNIRDKVNKGRAHKLTGSTNPSAILNEKQVHSIRHLYKNGATQVFLAKKFNVSQQTISSITRRKIWIHI